MKRRCALPFVAACLLGVAGCNPSDCFGPKSAVAPACPAEADATLAAFSRRAGEMDDSARVQRAIDALPSGVLYIPAGRYAIARTLVVTNMCSLLLHKNAVLAAVEPMEFVLKVNNAPTQRAYDRLDFGMFVKGGRIDGAGLASCMALDGFWHYTLRDVTFLNGKTYGLRVQGEAGGCEVIAENLYFLCKTRGLAGNTGLCVMGSDGHYTDIVVVDYTVGVHMKRGGSNRFTRCHVWGGPIPPPKPGAMPEMLKDSVNFWIGRDAGSTLMRDCYADTGITGFLIEGWETRLLGCSYFWNKAFGSYDAAAFRQNGGSVVIADGHVCKTIPGLKAYAGKGKVVWRDMVYNGPAMDWKNDARPGACDFQSQKSRFIDLAK